MLGIRLWLARSSSLRSFFPRFIFIVFKENSGSFSYLSKNWERSTCGGTVWHSHRLLRCIKYIIHPLHHSSSPPPLIHMVILKSICFSFIFMCTHFIAPYLLSYHLFPTPPCSHWCHSSLLGRTCSTHLFSDFVRGKKRKGKMKSMTF
jgi:hypothetical protein